MKRMLILCLLLINSFVVFAFDEKDFGCPVPIKYKDCISSTQGLRESLTEEEAEIATYGKWHNGIDFAVPVGTEVYAARDGVVVINFPGFKNGPQWKGSPVYGGLIVIKHDNHMYSMYGHLSYTKIHTNDKVFRGQLIGLSGGDPKDRASGISTGPHLHFAIYPILSEWLGFLGEEK